MALAIVGVVLAGCSDDERPQVDASATGSDEASASAGRITTSSATTTTTTVAASEQAYVDAVLQSGGLADANMGCYVRASLLAFGIEELHAAGVTPEVFATDGPDQLPVEVDDAKVPQLRDDLRACFDPVEFVIGLFAAPAPCVRPALDPELALDAVVDLARGLTDEAPGTPLGQLNAVLDACSPSPPPTDADSDG